MRTCQNPAHDTLPQQLSRAEHERDHYREALRFIAQGNLNRIADLGAAGALAEVTNAALEALDAATAFAGGGTTNPVTDDRIQRAARALAAEVGEEDVDDAITQLGYLESARKALTAALCPATTFAPDRREDA